VPPARALEDIESLGTYGAGRAENCYRGVLMVEHYWYWRVMSFEDPGT
jgi:hypothetical protein